MILMIVGIVGNLSSNNADSYNLCSIRVSGTVVIPSMTVITFATYGLELCCHTPLYPF